ncbi:hypothetical protein A3F58_04095 [Candidatus Roizmanbacteria bacterium RIFCSPHIGHO2_12_FULL_37_9b]|uniref:ABC transporter permease n=1 Tax=Candidatus Roizmanbacteria bacterium RIFCSPHIGHO2_02_FULL_38_11 TaxID=1802039 RepID=A0A1F7GZA9_9BACT|nr:MAG: hypothetical protein A3C25_05275 [Candidatus Roizmanbacteria bacterium RIFCSPHIGHO2_02_FULL_38_11]OGK32931.1 MAG: hypothetical protein A3F58_04095 [Candidatus Roizmanbacteria bacterium RIFCSPHIGHO2_12_FULL_37_9b]
MKFLKIFLLHFEGLFEHRFRSFIWFLIPVINMLPMILFWTLATKTNQNISWSMRSLNSYYLILIIAISMLTSHIEEDVGDIDIKQGELTRYLMRPFSYYWIKFFEEIPYRVLQGFYGITLFLVFSTIFRDYFQINLSTGIIFFGLISSIFAFLISFTFKMIVGYTAFWMTDNRAVAETVYILTIIFAGQVIPLDLFPNQFREIVGLLPFASMIYYPVIIFLGKATFSVMLKIISIQIFWLIFFLILERFTWRKGIKEFTALGQ